MSQFCSYCLHIYQMFTCQSSLERVLLRATGLLGPATTRLKLITSSPPSRSSASTPNCSRTLWTLEAVKLHFLFVAVAH